MKLEYKNNLRHNIKLYKNAKLKQKRFKQQEFNLI